MSPLFLGALLGGSTGVGVVVAAASAPPARRLRLQDRLAPYLRDTPPPSRLLAVDDPPAAVWSVAFQLLRPYLLGVSHAVGRWLGGTRSVAGRLAAVGAAQSVEDFRLEQVVWGLFGALTGVGLGVVASYLRGSPAAMALLFLVGGGFLGGLLARDWWLTAQVRRREQMILAEFPVIAELLALAVTAGEAPSSALERVCRLSRGELAREIGVVLAEARAGSPLVSALERLRERTSLEPLARFVDGVVIALERGTPLGEVLRAQAGDVREAGKRELLASGGRREIAMMMPVVFLILPLTVVFAFFPGLVTITQLTQ
jgi:tight adherence protein C